MISEFYQEYENFKKSLPKSLTPKQYEETIKKWLLRKEKGERVDITL